MSPGDDRGRVAIGEVAVRYAAHGWPVLPLTVPSAGGCSCGRTCGSPGKHPRIRNGLHNASVDPDQVRAWWARWPEANIGVRTGRPSGLLVVDVDLPDGPSSLADLERDHGPLPDTCQQRTGSGGTQLLFAHPDVEVTNRAGLQPGIDVRGDGGYIVVPPSRHATGDCYRWTARVPPAEAPGWLVELVVRRARTPVSDGRGLPAVGVEEQAGRGRYATVALQRELGRLSVAVEGTRNDTLNRAAFNLGQLVAGGQLDRREVTDRLQAVAVDIGLRPDETRRTIASGLSAGARHPRTPTDRSRTAAPVPRRGPRAR